MNVTNERSKELVLRALTMIFLFVTFVTTCWAEPVGVYVGLACAIVSTLIVGKQSLAAALRDPGVQCVVGAFAVLSLAFVFGAKAPDDGMAFLDFLALPALVPAFALLHRTASSKNALIVAGLGAIGALVAFAIGFNEVQVQKLPRASGGTSSIFFSDMAVLLGFFSLLGMLVWRSHWRWILAVANAAAVGAALYGGTRGAILAEIAILLLFGTYTLFWWARPLRTRMATAVGVVVITAGASVSMFDLSRVTSIFVTTNEIIEIAAGGSKDGNSEIGATGAEVRTSDESTNIRLRFWAAGLRSFLESPIYGHSWWNRFEAAIKYMPSDISSAIIHDKTAHLHNDIINFASGAGVMGVCAYFLIVFAPLISARSSRYDEGKNFRTFAATGLAVAYLVMGLTDTMFVFEIPKSMFILCSAVVMAFFIEKSTEKNK